MTRILHPTDFSECAEAARALATGLAQSLQAELVLLHVAVETPLYREGLTRSGDLAHFFEEQRAWAQAALEERAAEARGQGVPAQARVVTGVPHEAIVESARREGASLIVMGTHGRGPLERFLLGSVADRVIRTAPCPVVTQRAPAGG